MDCDHPDRLPKAGNQRYLEEVVATSVDSHTVVFQADKFADTQPGIAHQQQSSLITIGR